MPTLKLHRKEADSLEGLNQFDQLAMEFFEKADEKVNGGPESVQMMMALASCIANFLHRHYKVEDHEAILKGFSNHINRLSKTMDSLNSTDLNNLSALSGVHITIVELGNKK